MKKLLLLIAMLASATATTFADYSIDWTSTANNILTSSGTAVARDANDNVYTTTATGDIYLEKHDKFGNFKWHAHSFTTLTFNYEYPSQVYVDPQGNPTVVGFRYTSPSEGKDANSLIVLKYDPNGNLLYKLNIDGAYSYFSNSPMSMFWTKITSQMDAEGNIYIGTAGGASGYPGSGFTVVKVTKAGSVAWVSTTTFNSATQFHFVSNVRLKGNKLAVTGATSYSSANASNWVLDTTGTSLWSNVQEGVGGSDAAFDNNGNVYFLTWVSINFNGDVRLYKFNSTGTLLFQKSYDFGGSDLSARMELTPDNKLVIMAYGNTAPNNSYYVDWITFKVKLNGTLLWSKKYDHHASNDEIPRMMAVASDGDIFVTGIGGPYPGGSSLSRQQMVTVKYSSSGTEEWSYVTDTLNEYNSGEGIAVATDGSIFVVGGVNTFLVHILDHTGGDPCTVPTGITVTSISNEAATINWSAVNNAYLYHIQYKPATSLTWFQVATDALNHTLTTLATGTMYDFRVEAICNSGPTGYSAIQQFTTLGSGYCESKGLDATKEWIDLVYVGSLLNSTPESAGGYGDFTYLSVDMLKGASYSITLSAGMNPPGPTEVWRVWIDYNQDGDFLDSGEKEVAYKSSQIGWESHTFSVPATALTGTTRMRVSMKRSSAQTPCEVFSFGEVEDYTVNILPAKNSEPETATGTGEDIDAALSFVPNPTADATTINFPGLDGTITLHIFDFTGILMETQKADASSSLTLSTNGWLSGVYFIRASDEHGNIAAGKLIRQ